jgi:glutamine amidotransferase
MTTKKVTIVDYGVGNLYSVQRAFEVCGASEICISSKPEEIAAAERVVLPGVGAFANGMQELRARGLDHALRDFASSGRPLLGICLGMQLLATSGEEFGQCDGLNIIPGKIQEMARCDAQGAALKLPFIGWAPIAYPDLHRWQASVLESCKERDYLYLVHSFQFNAANADDVLATYARHGGTITAAVRRGNVTGLQFHPEKSGKVGLGILAQFLSQQ